ncbi:MAG: hypothetical protein U5L45_25350 [Saprospiraceae bacterium]|nr:hypothetical protein [Saprospiraceae bacterium]
MKFEILNTCQYKGLNLLLLMLCIYAENAVGMNDFVAADFNPPKVNPTI